MRFRGKAQLAFAGVGQLGSIHKVLWWRPHGKSQGFFVVPPMKFSGEGQHGTIRLCPEFLAGLLSHSRNPKFDNRGRRCVVLIRVLAACMDG